MSKELRFILSRTKRILPPSEKRIEPSENLMFLLQRMEFRRWKEGEIAEITALIKEYVGEVKWIRHMRYCKDDCILELVLAVERYGGRCCPWFLDLINDVREMIDWDTEDFEEPCLTKQQAKYIDGPEEKSFETLAENPQLFKTYLQVCPRVQDYKIGNYWVAANLHGKERITYMNKSHVETLRFIQDRMNWAEKIVLKQMKNACKYLKLVLDWDLNPETMPQWESRILEDSLEEPGIFWGVERFRPYRIH